MTDSQRRAILAIADRLGIDAGDSEGDLEMLQMQGVQLGLVIDRHKKGALQKIYDLARGGDAHWMVQGRDDYDRDGTAPGTWNGTRDTRP